MKPEQAEPCQRRAREVESGGPVVTADAGVQVPHDDLGDARVDLNGVGARRPGRSLALRRHSGAPPRPPRQRIL